MTKDLTIDKSAMDSVIIEIKLHINRELFNEGAITEEMFQKAKDLILRKVA